LNRNFPDQYRQIRTSEVEVKAMMNWVLSKHFSLSANFHGGAVVANYPFDGNKDGWSGRYSSAPDDEMFKFLASTYSSAHSSMWRSREFDGGITNGAEWYVLYGGMQDWNYVTKGCLEITVELSDNKMPYGSTLPSFWEENRNSLIAYMSLVHVGVQGIVADSNGSPLSANITVNGINIDGSDRPLQMPNEAGTGDFFRLLAPRKEPYKLTVTLSDGRSQSTTFEITPSNPLVVRNFTF